MKDFLQNKLFLQVYFVYLPLFLFFIFSGLFFSDALLKIGIQRSTVHSVPFSISSEAKIPVIKTNFVPSISATGGIIMDADSKVVLYSKNPDLRFSSASTTKIMTALTALDYYSLGDILTVGRLNTEGSAIGLIEGETMSFENLLYAMLLPSANDAATVIAENYPGGEKEFIKKMNEKARLFELYNTSYADSTGLTDSGDYTTPFDLARLASFATQNPILKGVVATKEKIIFDTTGTHVYNLENLNKLLGISGVSGIKTGYTEEAGEVLVTSKEEKGETIIIIVMGSLDRFGDTTKLLDLISNNLTYLSIHP